MTEHELIRTPYEHLDREGKFAKLDLAIRQRKHLTDYEWILIRVRERLAHEARDKARSAARVAARLTPDPLAAPFAERDHGAVRNYLAESSDLP